MVNLHDLSLIVSNTMETKRRLRNVDASWSSRWHGPQDPLRS